MRRELGWLALFALPLLLSLAFAACTVGDGQTKATSGAPGTTTADAPPQRAFVRTCETSAYGTLDAPAWKKHSTSAGPLVFYYADQYARTAGSDFDPVSAGSGYYSGQKLLVLVRLGTVATLVIPKSARPHATLLYNPADWNDRNAYRIEDGESAVTFKACKKGETERADGPLSARTQFNGAFVVAGVRCLRLEVFVRGEERTIPVTLSFGAGRCPSR